MTCTTSQNVASIMFFTLALMTLALIVWIKVKQSGTDCMGWLKSNVSHGEDKS